MPPKKDFRLPDGTRPISYDLLFEPDFDAFRFRGKEEISIYVTRPTSEIALNVRDLNITQSKVVHKDRTIEPTIHVDKERESLLLKLDQRINGPAKLLIDFEGSLNDDLTGFYRSKYQTKDGAPRYLATTQFEPAYARKAFPCFDEPEYKATFTVSMRVDKDLQALSNMPISEEHVEGSKKIVKFDKTPRMSTYLLYLGVGDFEYLEDRLGDVLIRVVTPPGKRGQGTFALDIGKKGLLYFQEKFGIKYPLPKLDLVAVPDFEAGAMENWGAITFREVLLLVDPAITSTRMRERVAKIIFHEQAHQWFGNLTTMRWWNDLWLNESFATFMAYKAAEHYFPQTSPWEDFVSDETQFGFDDDSLKTTHPIQVKISGPSEIEEVFDNISYSKGGSVLRMLENYLGDATFMKGVSRYLSEHPYENATSEDLWSSLATASEKPIEDVMVTWINQAGYPVLEVSHTENALTLAQKRFIFGKKPDGAKWLVPLVIKLSTQDEPLTALMDRKSTKLRLAQPTSWLKINFGQGGFYRVKSSDRDIAQLKPLIEEKRLPALDRWGVQHDLFKLSLNGDTTIDKYLDLLESYRNEDNFLVLSDLYSNLRHIHSVFSQEAFWPRIWPKFKTQFREPFAAALDRLGWEPRSDEDKKVAFVRSLAVHYLGFIEDPAVIQRAVGKYQRYLQDPSSLSPDMKAPVLCIATATGGREVYDKLMEVYSRVQSPEEKIAILSALSQFRDGEILKRFLDFLLTDKVRAQDLRYVFNYNSSSFYPSFAINTSVREVLLPWVKENWKRLQRLKDNPQIFAGILECVIGLYTGKSKENELRRFFAQHPVKYKMAVDRSFERMRRDTHWLQKNIRALARYFAGQK